MRKDYIANKMIKDWLLKEMKKITVASSICNIKTIRNYKKSAKKL